MSPVFVWDLLRLVDAVHDFAASVDAAVGTAAASQHPPPSAAADASAIEVTYTLDGII